MGDFSIEQFKFRGQAVVDANGNATVIFGPPYNQRWMVTQISIEMDMDNPVGCIADIRDGNSFVASAATGARATAGGDPPIYLNGGESITVNWHGSPPGDIGLVLAYYNKADYY